MRGRDLELDVLLRAVSGDAGCVVGTDVLAEYVELELAGSDPALSYPGTAIHLSSCSGCAADHAGLLEAAKRVADVRPD